ncbi:MAG TPA: sulfite exporter TauE/SafE family protein [Gemmatimonadaceae bacterium]|nr:sulfite exporter TauE/SafE family protein [Gemmatimonadaceae bacterium]
MTILVFAALVAAGAVCAGLLGALTGLGGGLIIVPMLTLLFHVDIRYAIGASLVSVIATSSGAAAAYVREGFTNVRVGILLETGTTIGALVGALISGFVPTGALAVMFGLVLLWSAANTLRPQPEHVLAEEPDRWARVFRLDSTYPTSRGLQRYSVQGVPGGVSLMFVAGILSALLGIGSGIIKVLAMDHVMKLPFKVSTTTSNFMIGVTAAASAGIYLHEGRIDPTIAFPVMIGVLVGALAGARLLTRAPTAVLRRLFVAVVLVMAVEMLYKGFTGGV